MTPGIYQRGDGTVYWLHEDGRWQYLSPLFGEWLDVFDQPNNGELEKYPRNLATWRPPGIDPTEERESPFF
jgi:hypothetical protein